MYDALMYAFRYEEGQYRQYLQWIIVRSCHQTYWYAVCWQGNWFQTAWSGSGISSSHTHTHTQMYRRWDGGRAIEWGLVRQKKKFRIKTGAGVRERQQHKAAWLLTWLCLLTDAQQTFPPARITAVSGRLRWPLCFQLAGWTMGPAVGTFGRLDIYTLFAFSQSVSQQLPGERSGSLHLQVDEIGELWVLADVEAWLQVPLGNTSGCSPQWNTL